MQSGSSTLTLIWVLSMALVSASGGLWVVAILLGRRAPRVYLPTLRGFLLVSAVAFFGNLGPAVANASLTLEDVRAAAVGIVMVCLMVGGAVLQVFLSARKREGDASLPWERPGSNGEGGSSGSA